MVRVRVMVRVRIRIQFPPGCIIAPDCFTYLSPGMDNQVTDHLSKGSFVRNVVVQTPKFDAKPNLILTLTQAITLTLCLYILDK